MVNCEGMPRSADCSSLTLSVILMYKMNTKRTNKLSRTPTVPMMV